MEVSTGAEILIGCQHRVGTGGIGRGSFIDQQCQPHGRNWISLEIGSGHSLIPVVMNEKEGEPHRPNLIPMERQNERISLLVLKGEKGSTEILSSHQACMTDMVHNTFFISMHGKRSFSSLWKAQEGISFLSA